MKLPIDTKLFGANFSRVSVLGMQIAVIEFARNVLGVKDATSEEFSKELTPRTTSLLSLKDAPQDNIPVSEAGGHLAPEKSNNLIVFMPEIDKTTMGGNMRLGRRATHFQEQHSWSKLRALYGNIEDIHERHRHRYEVNPEWVPTLEEGGLSFVGKRRHQRSNGGC